MEQRENFNSRLGFILVSAGCAVGLGNVWKFPYVCGENGGAAFILLYLLFLVILGFPILVCEFAVGRSSRKSLAKAFNELESEGSHWHKIKWMSIAGNYLIMMFYTMVGGWMLYYAYLMSTKQLSGLSQTGIQEKYNTMLASPEILIFWTLVVIVLAFGICSLGLKNGVERITKIMMLLLMILMIMLAVNSILLKGSSEGLKFYLVPNFDHLVNHGIGKVIFAAMSHAFFTLSVGIGSMEIFGSYLKKERKLSGEAMNVMILDTLIALVAGLIIFPACFAYDVEPTSGPGLLFLSLPNVFNHMKFGSFFGACFFIFLSFAALSTIIAVFENIICMTEELFDLSRGKAVIINGIIISIFSLPAIFGFNVWKEISIIGANTNIMDFEDFLVSYNALPLGSLVIVLFCVKDNGWGFQNFLKEANEGIGRRFPEWLKSYMKYGLPAIVVFIYLKGYYDMFKGQGTKALCIWMCVAILILVALFSVTFTRTRKKKEN